MFPFDYILPYPLVQISAFIGFFIMIYLVKRPKIVAFKKPFAMDSRRPREPVECDQKKRALRLKQRFSVGALPGGEIDAIVIGSGVGGLTSAAILAKSGRKVVVLEQHDQAGGCCHTFVEQGYEWDVGIHYIGRMHEKQLLRTMLDQLTEGQLGWQQLDEDFDNVILVGSQGEKQTIPIWGDRDRLLNDLINLYPEHEESLCEFFAMTRSTWSSFFFFFPALKLMPNWLAVFITKFRLYKLFTRFFARFHDETLKSLLDRMFGSRGKRAAELKTILNYCFGDYGTLPSKAGFGMLSVLYAHYTGGAYYPVGGASQVAYTMVPVIEKAGGRVLVNANVTEILTSEDTGKAIGVRVGTSSGPVEIRAPIVISNAGVLNTFKRLLPKELAAKTKIGQLIDSGRIKPSLGSFQIFVGLKGSQAELQLPAKNLWVYYDTDTDRAVTEWNNELDLDSAVESAAEIPFLFVGFPSAKDPTFNDRFPGHSVCVIITASPMEWFRKWEKEPVKKRSPDYQALKMRLARKCWDRVLDLYPQLADRLDFIDAGSPLSAAYYLNARDGETYGLDHDTERFAPDVAAALRPKVPEIENFYLTGQDILTCGFASGVFSGFLTCQTIMQPLGECSNLLQDLRQLHRKINASSRTGHEEKGCCHHGCCQISKENEDNNEAHEE